MKNQSAAGLAFLISIDKFLRQAGVESAHGVTVRVGVAEENFEGAGRHKDELERMKDEIRVVEL